MAKKEDEVKESPQAVRARLIKEGATEEEAKAESTKKPEEKKAEPEAKKE